jgi:nucleoid DNA-binding protein
MKTTKAKKQIIIILAFEMTRKELIDEIASHSKLTKADAGRALDAMIESIHKSLNKKLKVVFGGKGQRKLKTVFGGKG